MPERQLRRLVVRRRPRVDGPVRFHTSTGDGTHHVARHLTN